VGSAPAKTVTADADTVANRLAVAEHQIEPALGGVDVDRAGRVAAGKVDGLARDRAHPAAEAAIAEIGAAAQYVAQVEALRLRVASPRQHRHCRNQQSKSSYHFLPREKSQYATRQATIAAISQATSP
jgi:hypothetical protein